MVGAAANLVASWIPTRAQHRVADDDRKERKAEVLRAASAEYLVSVDSFIDAARELVYRIVHDAPELERESAHEAYLRDWQRVQCACAPVEIAGPSDLGARASELKLQLGSVANVCDKWHDAVKHGPTRSRVSQFDAAWESADKARTAFVSTAHAHAYQ